MAKKKSQKKKGGMAKRGRNLGKCESYRRRGVRERNKRKKIAKHFMSHPNDLVALNSIE